MAARQLVVRWNPGPELPAQNTFFEYLQKQPSHDALSVDSGDVTRSSRRRHRCCTRDTPILIKCTDPWVHRVPWLTSGRMPRHGVVRNPIGLSDAERHRDAAEFAAR